MKWKKKKGCLFLGSLILSAVLMSGCSGQDPETKQLRALCEELFSFPGGSADQVMAAAQMILRERIQTRKSSRAA